MRLVAALLILLSAAAAPAAPRGEGSATIGTLRLAQVRNADDAALVRLVFGRLAPFPYPAYRGGIEHRRPGENVALWFYSEARAGGRAGVCRTERLIVVLEPVRGSARDNPLLRPAGFDLQSHYIVENDREARERSGGRTRNLPELDAACRALDPRRDGTPAESAFQLVNAIELMEQLGAEARSGRLSVPLVCDAAGFSFDPPENDAACLARFAGYGRPHVDWVQSCRPRREAEGGCLLILSGQHWLEFDLMAGQRLARVVVRGVEERGHD
jgi:hypothetical protein